MTSTTIRSIINKAFREAGIIEVGGDPDGAEFDEAIALLQDFYSSLFGNELGEPLETVNYGNEALVNTYANDADQSNFIKSIYTPENLRLILNLTATDTIYLYPNPMDGARLGVIDNAGNLSTCNFTLNGNGRRIEGATSVTMTTNQDTREWFYRADLGNWMKVTDLLADDPSPLPREFDTALTTGLAIRLNPRYGAQTSQEFMGVLQRMGKQLRARYRQINEQRAEDGLVRIPSNRFWRYRNAATAFNRGRLA